MENTLRGIITPYVVARACTGEIIRLIGPKEGFCIQVNEDLSYSYVPAVEACK